VELEVHPAANVQRFVDFAQGHGCNCRVLGPGHQVELEVPLAGDPTEARRVAMEIITSFSATHEDADVRVVHMGTFGQMGFPILPSR
jgi:hypothetical protein